MKWYRFLREVVRPLMFIFVRIKAHNNQNIPMDEPLIICSNHLSLADPVLLGLTVRRPIRFIAKKEACHVPLLGKLITSLGAFAVDRDGKDLKAIRTCMSILKEGACLGIFPEGTRVINGKKSEAKAGVALIAKRSKAKIVMVRIKTKNNRVRPFSKVDLYFSDPTDYDTLCTNLDYTEASKKILDTINSLGE